LNISSQFTTINQQNAQTYSLYIYIYIDIALNIATCFGPQVTTIMESNKVIQRKNNSVILCTSGVV